MTSEGNSLKRNTKTVTGNAVKPLNRISTDKNYRYRMISNDIPVPVPYQSLTNIRGLCFSRLHGLLLLDLWQRKANLINTINSVALRVLDVYPGSCLLDSGSNSNKKKAQNSFFWPHKLHKIENFILDTKKQI